MSHRLKHYHKHSQTSTSLIQTHPPKQETINNLPKLGRVLAAARLWLTVTHEGLVLGQPTSAEELCRGNTLLRERSILEYGHLALLHPALPCQKEQKQSLWSWGKTPGKIYRFRSKTMRDTEGRRCAITEILAPANRKALMFSANVIPRAIVKRASTGKCLHNAEWNNSLHTHTSQANACKLIRGLNMSSSV